MFFEIFFSDYYYAVMKWTPGNELFVQWMNRAQNETVCMTYPPDKDEGKTVRFYCIVCIANNILQVKNLAYFFKIYYLIILVERFSLW